MRALDARPERGIGAFAGLLRPAIADALLQRRQGRSGPASPADSSQRSATSAPGRHNLFQNGIDTIDGDWYLRSDDRVRLLALD
ncbi:hypothetical protein [Kaistia sp. 32K]|uniref:hypothetical protein n=1 Tax=Kaistia sp. 32K TaxID=2795690 RepID=UPI001914F63F|nr:hypothetical protein [Kaistia sp. 32K]